MKAEALEAFARGTGDTLRLPGGNFTACEEIDIELVRYRVVKDSRGNEVARHLLTHHSVAD